MLRKRVRYYSAEGCVMEAQMTTALERIIASTRAVYGGAILRRSSGRVRCSSGGVLLLYSGPVTR